ncbi:hypothetical protein J1N35_019341 [Gossypium stocksii]|uniref:Cation-transporting P-type ATPase C-terminal domain-containing protein n=1 Tax=Gossypium stocksii TaxID=47602 RepID=A0A9D3VQR9_9ROSI|nr:hypothetical protein J1N35_019341 [Gossypium stocksii]
MQGTRALLTGVDNLWKLLYVLSWVGNQDAIVSYVVGMLGDPKEALNLDVDVKVITRDQLTIGKETGHRLGGFHEHKYEIVTRLQKMTHVCGMTGDGIGIAVDDATDVARGASDIMLTETGLSVIVSAVLTSRAIFQRMKNYTIYAVSITIQIVFGFMFLPLIWKFDFSPFMDLSIAILSYETIMTISREPSLMPNLWKLRETFATSMVLDTYLACMTVVFFRAAKGSDFFSNKFGATEVLYFLKMLLGSHSNNCMQIFPTLIFEDKDLF